MRNVLIIILLVNSLSFAQSKDEDLKEVNRISDLFFKEIFYHSCTWDYVSDFKHGIDTLSVKAKNDSLSFKWWFSYLSSLSGEFRKYNALIFKNKPNEIYVHWHNIHVEFSPSCIHSGTLKIE